MKRKTFLKTSAALVAGGFLPNLTACTEEKKVVVRKNWAGNYTYKAPNLHQPKTVEEVQALVKKLDAQKALGSCHCFNDIADSPANQISTKELNKIVSLDEKAMTVTVEAGAKYGQFCPELDEKGFAIHNLASLPHISVAGACATATHGSGVKNGNLASAVTGLEMVTGTGEVISLSREKDGDKFNGAVVGLGALGIVTKMTLAVQKSFQVRQDLFIDLPLQQMKEHFDDIMSSGYSVSLFTDWQKELVSQVWVKRKVDAQTQNMGAEFFGAKAATKNLHPIIALSAENCTEQMGVAGVWYERLPHFKMGFTPSGGEELQSEFFVSRKNAVDAILALEKKRDLITPQLMISEIRTVAADDLWLSPCYKQDSVAIHFTWKQHIPEVMALIKMIEAELEPFQYMPHWGKLFTITPSVLHKRYARFNDFLTLVKEYDPQGKFKNDYLNKNVFV
ncbi:MAG: FAD-binding protein [Saprospiraceae bacterium]|nr:FAD-binding protein [Saprospiraceae bacterium]